MHLMFLLRHVTDRHWQRAACWHLMLGYGCGLAPTTKTQLSRGATQVPTTVSQQTLERAQIKWQARAIETLLTPLW